jgi:hypothetical protein
MNASQQPREAVSILSNNAPGQKAKSSVADQTEVS